jgi:hypothetical protein
MAPQTLRLGNANTLRARSLQELTHRSVRGPPLRHIQRSDAGGEILTLAGKDRASPVFQHGDPRPAAKG